MSRVVVRALFALALTLLLPGPSSPDAKKAAGPGKAAVAEAAAREILARFDKGDPGWKVRTEALVRLARIGRACVPVLAEALEKGAPTTREFAAQALMLFADPAARPALEKAVDDPETGVRIYAANALSMFGRREASERVKHRREQDNWAVRRHMAFALERDDTPDPKGLRKSLAEFDLAQMDSARLGHMAPDLALTDVLGQGYRLSQYRGKKPVVLIFLRIA